MAKVEVAEVVEALVEVAEVVEAAVVEVAEDAAVEETKIITREAIVESLIVMVEKLKVEEAQLEGNFTMLATKQIKKTTLSSIYQKWSLKICYWTGMALKVILQYHLFDLTKFSLILPVLCTPGCPPSIPFPHRRRC